MAFQDAASSLWLAQQQFVGATNLPTDSPLYALSIAAGLQKLAQGILFGLADLYDQIEQLEHTAHPPAAGTRPPPHLRGR